MLALSGTNFSQALTKPSLQMLTASVTNHQAYLGNVIKHGFWRAGCVAKNLVSAHLSFSFILQGEKLNQWHLSYDAFASQFNWLSVTKCLGQASDFGNTRQIRQSKSKHQNENDTGSGVWAKDLKASHHTVNHLRSFRTVNSKSCINSVYISSCQRSLQSQSIMCSMI